MPIVTPVAYPSSSAPIYTARYPVPYETENQDPKGLSRPTPLVRPRLSVPLCLKPSLYWPFRIFYQQPTRILFYFQKRKENQKGKGSSPLGDCGFYSVYSASQIPPFSLFLSSPFSPSSSPFLPYTIHRYSGSRQSFWLPYLLHHAGFI